MKKRKICHFSTLLLCLALWQTPLFAQNPVSENQSPEDQIDETELIHQGDLIDVDVVGSLEFDWRGTLNPEGFLDGIDFIENPIYAQCRSESEVAAEIAKAYSKNLRDPKVVVKILDRSNRPIALITGAVKTPQRLRIKRRILLNELIIISGGLTDTTSGEVQIYRPPKLNCEQKNAGDSEKKAAEGDVGKTEKSDTAAPQSSESGFINIKLSDLLSGKKEANPPILGGDIVTVQQAAPIYIIGGVANPKQISSKAQTTLSRAIDSAGGLTKNADAKNIVVYRRENGETKIIEADLDQIKLEKTPDVVLKAFDIIEVAQNGRGKSNFPPVINAAELTGKSPQNFPLRIIE